MYQQKPLPPKPSAQDIAALKTHLAAQADVARADVHDAIERKHSREVIQQHTQRHDTAVRHLATFNALAARAHERGV